MNDKNHECRCWTVELRERPVDFAATCACSERCDCAGRRRVNRTLSLLAVFLLGGAIFGVVGARRDDAANRSALIDAHLRTTPGLHGGGGR